MEYIKGGIYPIRVGITADNGVTLSECKWEVVFAVREKRQRVTTGIVVNENEVDVYLDTSKLPSGKLQVQLNLEFADSNVPEGTRTLPIDITNPDDFIVNGL